MAQPTARTRHYNEQASQHRPTADGGCDCADLPAFIFNLTTDTMTPPNPDLHTFYDNELGERVFYSCDPIAYDVGDHLIIVPELFLSDGLSIPSAARPLINTPKAPEWIGAGVLHDWLYSNCDTPAHQKITRKMADVIFLLAMKHLYGVGAIKRRIIYWAVRTFGRLAFRKKSPKFATNNHHD